MWPFTARPATALPPRAWFQDQDGTYYRNVQLISLERDHVLAAFPLLSGRAARHLDELDLEWDWAWEHGLIRKDFLEAGDVLAFPASPQQAYPGSAPVRATRWWPRAR